MICIHIFLIFLSSWFLFLILQEFLNCRALNGDFHPDITPIVLAAHHNNYDIIKILLEYGARIEEPEYYVFSTETNTLQHSLGLLNIYRALASQAYISLTSIDPINTAFEKGYLLRKLSRKNAEFSEAFIELAEQCEQFAADILGHIRNHKEQTCVLYHDPNMYEGGDEDDDLGPYKVKVAINLQQKKVKYKVEDKGDEWAGVDLILMIKEGKCTRVRTGVGWWWG